MNDLGQLARLATPTLRRRLQITSNRHFIRICENAQFWVGALDGFDVAHPGPAVTEDGVALARHVAADGTVLVHNAGALPLDASAVTSVAVIGHNARYARSQGGGSATVIPERVVSPLEGIRAVLPGGGRSPIRWAPWCRKASPNCHWQQSAIRQPAVQACGSGSCARAGSCSPRTGGPPHSSGSAATFPFRTPTLWS